jgi:hypothetical protein
MRTEMIPGVNVDRLDIDAGMRMACDLAYNDEREQMLIHYGLLRWAKGEEEQADKLVTEGIGGIKVTFLNWRMILAAARAAG